MRYFYRYCNNRTCACRGWCEEGDTIETRELVASSDIEALKQIIKDVNCEFYDDNDEELDFDEATKGLSVEKLIDIIDNIDIDGGYEFVFWIEREDGAELYNSNLDEDDFVGDPCCDDYGEDEDF